MERFSKSRHTSRFASLASGLAICARLAAFSALRAHGIAAGGLLALSLGACAANKFSVKSEPIDATVSLRDKGTGANKAIGKTPLEMPLSELKEKVGDAIHTGEIFTIVVEKQGYVTQTFALPATGFGTMATLVDVKLSQGETPRETRAARDLLDRLFLAQKFALAQQYERAQIELDKILADFPEFPRALSMRASIYFAQKNWGESQKWYEAALKADPKMDDAVKMIAKTREMQGGRAPSRAPAPDAAPAKDKAP
jgi:tetratricopeptide (TPR) repeat protein